jgi:hypothetical protein
MANTLKLCLSRSIPGRHRGSGRRDHQRTMPCDDSLTNLGIAAVIADNILVTTGHGYSVEVSAQQFQMAAE